MAVQMIENWSRIQGLVCECIAEAGPPDFVLVRISIEEVQPVEGYPNLLEGARGHEIPVLTPGELVVELQIQPGDCIRCDVRQAGPGRYYVHRERVQVEHRCEE